MSDSLRLQRKMHKTLCQHVPDRLSRPQRRNLAWMMAGLHQARHVHLSRIADYRVGSATLDSKTRQLRRLLANDGIDPQRCYEPLARQLLAAAAASGPVRLLVDTLELSGRRQILMAALAWRRRALPIRWQVRRRKGVSEADQQKALLEALRADLPADTEVVIVGDGAFHSTDLMAYVDARPGWHFRLRLHADTYAKLPSNGWKQLKELAPKEGQRRYLDEVYLTKGDPYGPTGLAMCHGEGEDDPWFIATDEPAGYLTIRTYSRRMWIEELFGDFEGGGFQLHRSRIYKPQRLSRLVMALAWVYVWLAHVGSWVVKRGLRPVVDRADRRDRSLIEIGRRWIRRCMTNNRSLRVRLKPYF
jgi:hypothetical protein